MEELVEESFTTDKLPKDFYSGDRSKYKEYLQLLAMESVRRNKFFSVEEIDTNLDDIYFYGVYLNRVFDVAYEEGLNEVLDYILGEVEDYSFLGTSEHIIERITYNRDLEFASKIKENRDTSVAEFIDLWVDEWELATN